MRMSHLYQPLMLRTLIDKGGTASLHDIASAFLTHDESQIEITERMPVLTRHQLVERDGDGYRLIPDVQQLSRQERDRLLRLCDEALETYTGRRGRNLYDHRRIALGDISGTARYEVLKRAGFRCDLCGISATVQVARGAAATLPPLGSSGSPTQPAGPKAGGMMPQR
jgi:ATP adenylyltransferase